MEISISKNKRIIFRFVMGFAAWLLACPHRMKGADRKEDLLAVLAAFVCGDMGFHYGDGSGGCGIFLSEYNGNRE